jgi:hypothetical protein
MRGVSGEKPKLTVTSAENLLEILVNLSGDKEILENLATDEKFLDVILLHITVSFPYWREIRRLRE